MNVDAVLDNLARMIESARAMPMSASCIINRGEALTLISQLRQILPPELHHAQLVLRDRDVVVEEGRRKAEQIIAAAHDERNRILASAPADPFEQPTAGQFAQAAAIKQEADEYVDQQLASLEVILDKALASVKSGRDRLRIADPFQETGGGQPGHPPLASPDAGSTEHAYYPLRPAAPPGVPEPPRSGGPGGWPTQRPPGWSPNGFGVPGPLG